LLLFQLKLVGTATPVDELFGYNKVGGGMHEVKKKLNTTAGIINFFIINIPRLLF